MKTDGSEIRTIKFGSTPADTDKLASKVITGEKTATSSIYDYHLMGLKQSANLGEHFSVLNSTDKEVAIIEIEKVDIVSFGDITEEFAIQEGDGSLDNWLAIHRPYYSRLLNDIGKTLDNETLLVCEWFKLARTS